MDGTTNHVPGVPFLCTSVALERAGEVIAGVVHDPMANDTYASERGGGATLNGEPIGASGTDKPARALLGMSFADRTEELEMGPEVFGRLEGLARGMRRLGSGALDLCYVATGRLDGCYEQGFSVWNVAAGMLIVEEAGGKITNCRGQARTRERRVGGGNGLLHPDLLRVTGGHQLLGYPVDRLCSGGASNRREVGGRNERGVAP